MAGLNLLTRRSCLPMIKRLIPSYYNCNNVTVPHIIIINAPVKSCFGRKLSLNFRHLNSHLKGHGDHDFTKTGVSRYISLWNKKDERNNKKKRRVPKLILLQNPFKWFWVKIDFSVLKHIWDPTFQESEFKYGTKQAISRVTHLISTGNLTDLNGLLTKPARLSLMRELDRNWGQKQRTLLALDHDDIQVTSPRKVYFIRIADKKFCDVDMAFLALKWVPINSVEALIFAEIFARFHREYTPHSIPEWTIAYFKVTRFEVLRR